MTDPTDKRAISDNSVSGSETGSELRLYTAEIRRDVRQLWTVEASSESEARDVLLGEREPRGAVDCQTGPGEPFSEILTVEILTAEPVGTNETNEANKGERDHD